MAAGTDALAAQLKEIKDLLAAGGDSHQEQAATGFNIKLGGNNYSVANGVEAQRLIDQYEGQVHESLEAERLRADSAREHASALPTVQAGQEAGFDKNAFAELFLKDPREANRYQIKHDPELRNWFASVTSELTELKQKNATNEFLRQHSADYHASPKNFKAIESVMAQNNLPWHSTDALNLAFFTAKQQGLLEDAPTQQRGRVNSEEEEYLAQRTPAPPRTSRSRSNGEQSQEAELLENFERLTPDQMKAYIEKQTSGR